MAAQSRQESDEIGISGLELQVLVAVLESTKASDSHFLFFSLLKLFLQKLFEMKSLSDSVTQNG